MIKTTMIKTTVGGAIGVLLYFCPAVAQSQEQRPNPELLAQTFTPKGASETISPIELQQFAQALKQLKTVEMEIQQKMVETLKQERLSPQRFQEIGRRQSNPDFPLSTQVSPNEQQQFNKALAKIQTIQQEALPKQNRAITLQGLTVERFNQIGQTIEKNPVLKQQLQNRLF